MRRGSFGKRAIGLKKGGATKSGKGFGTGSKLKRLTVGQKARVTGRRAQRTALGGLRKVRAAAGTKAFRRTALVTGGALAGGAAVYAYSRRKRK